MSGQFTDRNQSLSVATPGARVWNNLTSAQNEGSLAHTVSLSGSTFDEATFYSQSIITCSSKPVAQVAHGKTSRNWHNSTLLCHTVDSLPKSVTPLHNLQTFVDDKHSQIKNVLDKKEATDSIGNINTNSSSKISQVNKVFFNSRNSSKALETEISLHRLSNEHSLFDSIIVPPATSLKYNSENYLNSEREIISKIPLVSSDNNKIDMSGTKCNKSVDKNTNFADRTIDYSSALIIEKRNPERKDSEIVTETEISSVIVQEKSLIPAVINLISKSDRNGKEEIQEFFSDTKRNINDFNMKISKSLSKKGKKGVDSLLEKFESNNKKYCNVDNPSSTTLVQYTDEKDTNSVRSMSPEYYKSRSPYREDDVVSPSLSNDDSNDTKQRRKRKLGKPIRLAKDLKLDQDDAEFEMTKSKTPVKSEILDYSTESNKVLVRSSELSSYNENHRIQTAQFEEFEDNNIICPSENKQSESDLKLNNFELSEESIHSNKIKNSLQCNNSKNLAKNVNLIKNHKTIMSQYLLQTIKNSQCIKTRRCSESYDETKRKLNTSKNKRRKSCDDATDFFHKSDTKINVANTVIAFNEVESQLEKMFAGLIESDKDLFKKKILESERSVSLLSDNEQKENLHNEKFNTKHASNTFSTSAINTNNCQKAKNMSKIRSYKKRTKNSFKNISDASINILNKDKKGQILCKQSFTKSNVLKKNKKYMKFNNFQESTCDVPITTNPVKYRGPVIQIKGSKSRPIYVQIVNVPREDDEERHKEKRRTFGNGSVGRSKRLNYQNNVDYRGKVCNTGLFNSTLSVRYDAHTADVTWICVFCKRGPHFIIPGDARRPHPNVSGPHIIPGTYTAPVGVLSDLFGPYLIGKDLVEEHVTSSDELEIPTDQKQGNKHKRNVRCTGLTDQILANVGKRKRKHSNHMSNIHLGMTMLGVGDEHQWEVWLHEQCVVWTAGVYITGGRISGLQDAVWDTIRSICDFCGLSGANIGCIKQYCKSVAHYCCALTAGWDLDINEYIPKCSIHRIN